MTIYEQILQARQTATDSGITPNAIRLGLRQWREIQERLIDSTTLEGLNIKPSRIEIHGLSIRLALDEPDLCEAIISLEVPA